MTVLLVHLPVGFEESYPLALAAIASPAIARGHVLEGLDVARAGLDGLRARLSRGDVTVVGLSVWTPAAAQARQVVAEVRRAPSRPVVVIGGPHATLAPNDVPADYTISGEGEQDFAALLDALAAGRSWQPDPDGSAPLDLDSIPLPDRRIFPVADYHRDHLPRGRRYASSVTSRGCQYRCSFCSAPALWGRKHRYRSAESVVDEWTALRVDHGVDGILVEDDLFTHHRRRVFALCERLIRESPDVTWELLNGIRPESVDEELLGLMARAGCTRIAFSLETADPERLVEMGRTPDLARVEMVVRAARKAGIGVTGYFMIGLPGERRRDRLATFRFASKLRLDMAHFSVASAWPGTTWRGDLVPVPAAERSAMYGSWYLHPARAVRAARMLGVRPGELVDMGRRLGQWMTRPLEARRVEL